MEHRRFIAVRLMLWLLCGTLLMGGTCEAPPSEAQPQTTAERSATANQSTTENQPAAAAPTPNPPAGSDATELMQMNTMNAKFIAGLARMLMDDPFEVAEMERYLGPVVNDDNPEHVKLKSRLEDLSALDISWDDKQAPAFVHTIYATYDKPMKLDTGLLVKELGEAEEKPRLKPDQPHLFQIELKGKRYAGNLLLSVEGGNWRRDPVTKLRLMRYFPEPE